MNRVARICLPGLAAAVAVAGLVPSAEARDPDVAFIVGDVMRVTPRCSDYPSYPIVGRVAGQVGWSATGVSFTGCFPTYAACDAWRGPVSGKISGRLFYSTCEPRR